MFERTEREVYDVNPLREVVCQLTFPDILEITATAPASFQKLIRAQYPFYYKRPAPGQFPADMPEQLRSLVAQQIGLQVAQAHHFISKNQRRQVILLQNAVVLSSLEYTEREAFIEELKAVEAAFQKAYGEPFYTRVAIKYVNIINKTDQRYGAATVVARDGVTKLVRDCDWLDLLRTSVVGLLGEKNFGSPVSSTSSLVFQLPETGGRLRMKHGLLEDQKRKSKDYLIEMEFYAEEQLTDERLYDRLRGFQDSAGNIFRWAVRDGLRSAFGIRPLP